MPRIYRPVIIEGAKIIALRRQLGWISQIKLAEQLGVNEKTVRRWEKSRAKLRSWSPVLKTLRELAKSKKRSKSIKFDLGDEQASGYVDD